jgi:hypothetical protein
MPPLYDDMEAGQKIETDMGECQVMYFTPAGATGLNHAFGPLEETGMPNDDDSFESYDWPKEGTYLVPASDVD